MNANTITAEAGLNVTLQEALASGRIQVHVTDNHDPPRPIQGVQVAVSEGTTPVAQGVTNANGEVTLEIDFGNLNNPFTPKRVTVIASQLGFTQGETTATVIAVATIDVNLTLVPQ